MKRIFLTMITMFLAVALNAQKCRNISVFADHIYNVAKQKDVKFSEAARMVKKTGVRGVDVYVTMNEADLQVLDKRGFRHASAIVVVDLVGGECRAELYHAIDFMKKHDFSRALLVPGLMTENPTAEMYATLYDRIERFAKLAKTEGIEVSVEDYDNERSPCYDTARLDRMLAACPSLSLTFDTGNFCIVREEVMKAREHFDGRISHVHLKERKVFGEWPVVAVGTGCVPTREFVSSLLKRGYKGWFTIECFGAQDMLADIATGVRTLKAI